MEQAVIRECTTIDELDQCVRLQKEVFGLPDLEISPRRHLIVSRQAGGWTLGAFVKSRLVGFVHHLVAVRGPEVIGYSHMMAVDVEYQNQGVGARLKWAQRERALADGRTFIKWTWDPMQSRNAHFNINRLGVTVRDYAENFYGTDYFLQPGLPPPDQTGIDSDRLIASWDIRSPRVTELARGGDGANFFQTPIDAIEIPVNWISLVRSDVAFARKEQLRVRKAFKRAFASDLICAGFERGLECGRYLLYEGQS